MAIKEIDRHYIFLDPYFEQETSKFECQEHGDGYH